MKQTILILLFGIFLVAGALVSTEVQAQMTNPKPEANLPLNMQDAMKNINNAMMMMMGSEEDQKKMMEMMQNAQKMAIDMGENLFNDTKLSNGSMGRSCNTCHPNGGTTNGAAEIPRMMGYGPFNVPIPSLIGVSEAFPKFKAPNGAVISLEAMNNNCVAMFVGGERLPLNSTEAFALSAYMKTLK